MKDPRSKRMHEVLKKALDEGKPSVTARMWAYRPFELPVNVFDLTVSRHRDGPDDVLRDASGLLMADCWSGFQKIELRSDARIKRAACWAHARRKIFEASKSHPQKASVLLAMIRELYDIEDRAKTFSPDERLALRQRESRPVLARIRVALDGEAAVSALPKSSYGIAVGYIRNHWDALNVFTTDGRLPIDTCRSCTVTEVRRRLRNANTLPRNGSSRSAALQSCTRPSIPLRKSTGSMETRIRI